MYCRTSSGGAEFVHSWKVLYLADLPHSTVHTYTQATKSIRPACCSIDPVFAGVFAVLAFVQAIVWLNISASALVQVCVVVGVIFGLQPALLGATVLAWGNSVPDLINNMAMAQDGFPSMAVAACFASPLFTLLIGMGGALAYGECVSGGVDGAVIIYTVQGAGVVNLTQHNPAVYVCRALVVRPFWGGPFILSCQ